MRQANFKFILFGLVIVFLVFGVILSVYWIRHIDGPDEVATRLPSLIAGLVLTISATVVNISLRWIRWHFLTRSIGARLSAKDSLLIYLVTLPAVLTPFSVGELLRAPLLGKKYPRHRLDIVYIWLMERSSDLLALALFTTFGNRSLKILLGFLFFWLIIIVGIRFRFKLNKLRNWPSPFTIVVLMFITILAWAMPGLALSGILYMLKSPLTLMSSLSTFASTTIFGGITGAPLGVGVTGSLLVQRLQVLSIDLSESVLCTLVFRMGTAWFAVSLGIVTILISWKKLLYRLQTRNKQYHFDGIADTYKQQIPEYVRRHLLVRKVEFMHESLKKMDNDTQKRGLDIGCGQGWYTCEMARFDYQMYGIDKSERQIKFARQCANEQNITGNFLQGSAESLPFEDSFFDFAYAINILHHITDCHVQLQVFMEIVRVLKPGGIFFLQEINTLNPLFRFYMGYIFPLIRTIDEGNERWIRPDHLPDVPGACWEKENIYFTFLPDFVPVFLLGPLSKFERSLEKSCLKKGSAHYVAKLITE